MIRCPEFEAWVSKRSEHDGYTVQREISHSDGLRKRDGWWRGQVTHGEAAALVRRLHYSRGAANTSVLCVGLRAPGGHRLVGATMWMPPPPGSQRWAVARGYARPVMLSRMVLEDCVPRNGASYMLAEAVRRLRRHGWDLAVTWADPLEGHDGHVYIAAGWQRCGVTPGAPRWVDARGRMRSRVVGPQRLTVAECEARGWTRVAGAPKPRFTLELARVRPRHPDRDRGANQAT